MCTICCLIFSHNPQHRNKSISIKYCEVSITKQKPFQYPPTPKHTHTRFSLLLPPPILPASSSAAVARTVEAKSVNKPSRLSLCVAMGNAQCSAEDPPSVPTDTHVIKCDLFLNQSKGIIWMGENVCGGIYSQTVHVLSHQLQWFWAQKKVNWIKKSKYIDCCSAVPESAQTPVEVEQSASSLPDSQYTVIHCTPAAGSHSPSLS